MSYDFYKLKNNISEAEDWFKKELTSLHTGRATPMVLDGVLVDSYGVKTPVKNLSAISVEDPRTLRVEPWDKNQIKDIERSISEADIGLSVSIDNQGLRVKFPELTEETRARTVKILRDRLEEARIRVRKARDEAWNEIQEKEKSGGMGVDEKFRLKEQMQKTVDEANKSLEEVFEKKEKDVMTI